MLHVYHNAAEAQIVLTQAPEKQVFSTAQLIGELMHARRNASMRVMQKQRFCRISNPVPVHSRFHHQEMT